MSSPASAAYIGEAPLASARASGVEICQRLVRTAVVLVAASVDFIHTEF